LLEVRVQLLKIVKDLTLVAAVLMSVATVAMPLSSVCQDQTPSKKLRLDKDKHPAAQTAAPKTRSAAGGKANSAVSSSMAPSPAATKALAQAKSLEKSGNYSRAITALDSSTKTFPTVTEIYLELGNCLIHERRLNDALLNANTVLSKCPPTAAVYRQRATANCMLHDYANTLKDLDQACKMSPSTAEDYFTRATCLSNAGNSKAVIENLTAGLKLDPKNTEAYYLRAKTYKNLNQNALSEADFAKAMSLEK
jgi:tetratricopeptide (TPR) repeat protein